MAAQREIELKLEVSPKRLPALERNAPLLQKAQKNEPLDLVSVYFDSDNLKLHRKGLSLRVRRVGGRHVQTIKRNVPGNAGVFDRDEWETEIESELPEFAAARGTPLEPLLNKKLRSALKPVFATHVRRTIYPISHGHSEIELSVDNGTIEAGGLSSPLCEIELELKQGDPPELFRLAQELARHAPVSLNIKSKAERGYELLTGEALAPKKSVSVQLSPQLATQDAFKAVAHACLHQLLANVPALRAGDSEGLHQARVSLRRLRAAISLFSDLLHDDQTEAIKRELKWLTSEFGPAREADVFTEHVAKPAGQNGGKNTLAGLSDELKHARERAFEQAESAVDTTRFRSLALDIAAWIETGDWTRAGDDLRRTLGKRPIAKTSVEQLQRRWRRIIKRGKSLEALDPRKRHKLRIAAKKLRYATEFFADVFPGKKAAMRRKRFVSSLKALQSCLGDLNDITVHEKFSARLAGFGKTGPQKKDRINQAFIAGRLSGREEARIASVLNSAQKAYTTFAQAKPYWN